MWKPISALIPGLLADVMIGAVKGEALRRAKSTRVSASVDRVMPHCTQESFGAAGHARLLFQVQCHGPFPRLAQWRDG